MKLNNFKIAATALTLLASLPTLTTVANAQPQILLQQPVILQPRINPDILQLAPVAQISGTIANGGSNNGGQPNFICNEIEIYAAQAVPSAPPVGGGISLPEYKKIGQSVKATGNIASGCEYTLPLTAGAINKPIYLFATSPEKWTTAVNVVDISPVGWNNSIQVSKNQSLNNMNMRITATLIK